MGLCIAVFVIASIMMHTSPIQGQNVFTGDIISGLKSETNFTVIINPSGVVMWYLYPVKSLGDLHADVPFVRTQE